MSQLAGGVNFSKLRKTIRITFVDFLVFPSCSRNHSRFSYREWDDGFILTDINELHFLELPKFRGEYVESLSSSLNRWLHLLYSREHH
ncbi:MAG: PD-(D/E)XK nuclease family transposase [Vulcanimicrobiota bacterium]